MSVKQHRQTDVSRWSTRQLVTMSLFCALATVLSFIEFPIFPAAPFLKYDASLVPIMVGGFAYGPGSGVLIGVVTAVLHGIIMGDLAGSVMNCMVTVGYVLPAALIYKKHHRRRGAFVGLTVGSVCAVAMALLGNLVITPIYTGVPLESVIAMILPILLPFNALKALINSLLTALCYKSISNLITPKKEQVEDVQGMVVPTYWNAENTKDSQVRNDSSQKGAKEEVQDKQPDCANNQTPCNETWDCHEVVLSFENVSYSYDGSDQALDDISFQIHRGDFFGIAGATGSGKSTLILHMNGLNQPQKGHVLFCGRDLSTKENARSVPAHVGVVFQYPEYQLFASTVADDIAFGPCNLGLDAEEIKRRVARSLELVHLDTALANKNPFELSGGQQRRVAIAGILAMEPEVLVLDEPCAGLDPAGQTALFMLLDELHAAGTTIVLVSHDMDDLLEHCNQLLVLSQGKQVYLDTPSQIFTDANANVLRSIGLDLPRRVIALSEGLHE